MYYLECPHCKSIEEYKVPCEEERKIMIKEGIAMEHLRYGCCFCPKTFFGYEARNASGLEYAKDQKLKREQHAKEQGSIIVTVRKEGMGNYTALEAKFSVKKGLNRIVMGNCEVCES